MDEKAGDWKRSSIFTLRHGWLSKVYRYKNQVINIPIIISLYTRVLFKFDIYIYIIICQIMKHTPSSTPWTPNSQQKDKITMISAMIKREQSKDLEIERLLNIIDQYKRDLIKDIEIRRLLNIIEQYKRDERNLKQHELTKKNIEKKIPLFVNDSTRMNLLNMIEQIEHIEYIE